MARTPAEVAQLTWDDWVRLYSRDPLLFVREVLGVEPFEWQIRVLARYAAGSRRISIRSGHGVGKTALLAWIILHHMLFRFPQKTIATAPTEDQLFDALFAETRSWYGKLPEKVRALLEAKSEGINLRASPEAPEAPNESFFSCRTARPEKPEALAGVHSENVLLVCDEASGIPEKIFEAGSGSMSGHNAVTILAGNPVRSTGLFYDTHHKLKHRWDTFHVSCENNPNVSPDYVEDMEIRYGRNSNQYRVRVLGEFPTADDNTIIPRAHVEAAAERDVADTPGDSIVWGLDCARGGGDLTVLTKRRMRSMVEPQKVWDVNDTMVVVGKVKHEWDNTTAHQRPLWICVDVIGIGAGVVDRLRELGLPVLGVNVSESPAADYDKYRNVRTELWFKAKDWFAALNCRLHEEEDQRLQEELITQTYEIVESNGKSWAHPKKKVKELLGRSPDRADSFILTFAVTVGIASGQGKGQQGSWGPPLRRNLTSTNV